MHWELADIDVLRRMPDDLHLGEDTAVYVILWAAYRPIGVERLEPVDGRIERERLQELVWKYRSALSRMETPKLDCRSFASVVVCTFQRDSALEGILMMLEQQRYGDFEIIVVDNAPQEPGTSEIVARFGRARYVPEPRRGIRYARNAGAHAARGEIVAFIDDDCVPHPRWLASIACGFRDPQVGCCTGPILPLRLRTPAQWPLETGGGFNRGLERHVFCADCRDAEALCLPLHSCLRGSGANMAFRKSVLDRVGRFDETLPTAEDIDIFFRVMRHGHKVVYEPAAAVRHDHPEEYANLQDRMYDWGRGYVGYLLHIAATDTAYRKAAIADIRNWFSYQARRRLWPQLRRREPYPRGLTLRELYGGTAALAGFWLYPLREISPPPAALAAGTVSNRG